MLKTPKVKKFKVKKKDPLWGRFLSVFVRIFKRKPKFINLNGGASEGQDLPKRCILIANHNGAGGPFSVRFFLKHRIMIWGAHPMCEGFRSRRRYLYHIFYRQKLGWSKPRAFFMSIFFGMFSKVVYSYAGMIPTYTDGRYLNTIKNSMQCIEEDVSVLIFPEDSSEGYKAIIERFFPGFVHFAKLYYKRHKEDLPIFTCYYHKKPKTIVIGKPMYLQQLLEIGTEDDALETFRVYMNSLAAYVNPPQKPDKVEVLESELKQDELVPSYNEQ